MTLPQLSLTVVGADFPNKRGPTRRFEIAVCAPGEPVELRPEPHNEADPSAVAVYSCRAVQLGYLSAERCGRIGSLIRQGREVRAIFQEPTRYGAAIRLAFDGDDPVLPQLGSAATTPQSTGVEQDHDFWPDPEWPDEFD